jgi:hypothetical protein
MARKRRLVALGIVLVAFAAGSVVHFYERSQRRARGPFIDREHWSRIKKGMSQDEVDTTLGAPPGNYAAKGAPVEYFEPPLLGRKPKRRECWIGDGGLIVVAFDSDGRVEYAQEGIPSPVSLPERVRAWFRLVWP